MACHFQKNGNGLFDGSLFYASSANDEVQRPGGFLYGVYKWRNLFRRRTTALLLADSWFQGGVGHQHQRELRGELQRQRLRTRMVWQLRSDAEWYVALAPAFVRIWFCPSRICVRVSSRAPSAHPYDNVWLPCLLQQVESKDR